MKSLDNVPPSLRRLLSVFPSFAIVESSSAPNHIIIIISESSSNYCQLWTLDKLSSFPPLFAELKIDSPQTVANTARLNVYTTWMHAKWPMDELNVALHLSAKTSFPILWFLLPSAKTCHGRVHTRCTDFAKALLNVTIFIACFSVN